MKKNERRIRSLLFTLHATRRAILHEASKASRLIEDRQVNYYWSNTLTTQVLAKYWQTCEYSTNIRILRIEYS